MSKLVSDVQARLKVINPNYAFVTSGTFDTWAINAVNLAQNVMLANYVDADDLFVKKTTLDTTAPASGSAVADTTTEDMYKLTLVTGALRVRGDTIVLYNPATADYKVCPRTELAALVVGTTVVGFYETNGEIVILFKDATFSTTPYKIQYDYYRSLTAVAATSDPLDVKDTDFDTFVGLVLNYMPQL